MLLEVGDSRTPYFDHISTIAVMGLRGVGRSLFKNLIEEEWTIIHLGVYTLMIIIRSLIKVQQNRFHWFKTGIQYQTRKVFQKQNLSEIYRYSCTDFQIDTCNSGRIIWLLDGAILCVSKAFKSQRRLSLQILKLIVVQIVCWPEHALVLLMTTMNIQLLLIHLSKHKIGILKISIYLPNKQKDLSHFLPKNPEPEIILSETAAFHIAKNLFHPLSVSGAGYSLSVSLVDPWPFR